MELRHIAHVVAVSRKNAFELAEGRACVGLVEAGGVRRVREFKKAVESFQFWTEEVAQLVEDVHQVLKFLRSQFRAGLDGERLRLLLRRALLDEGERVVEVRLKQFGVARDAVLGVERFVDRLIGERVGVRGLIDGGANRELLRGGDGLGRFVAACLPDGRKDFGGNPTLEALGRLELGAEDQSVETRLVDAVDRLSTTKLVSDFLFDEVFGIDVLRYSVRGLLKAES